MTSGSTPPSATSTSSGKRRRHPLIHFWTYTLLRVALFAALWGILWVSGLGGLIGAAVALALSVPLSYVLLARPRQALAEEMHLRLTERQERESSLDADLARAGLPEADDRAAHATPAETATGTDTDVPGQDGPAQVVPGHVVPKSREAD